MTESTEDMLDIIEQVKGKRNPELWDPRCKQYMAAQPTKKTSTTVNPKSQG